MTPRTIVTYVAATIAAVLMFAGAMLVWIILCLITFGDVSWVEPGPSSFVQWIVGGLGGVLALAAAVYSFRATVKAEKPKASRQTGAEIVKWNRDGSGDQNGR